MQDVELTQDADGQMNVCVYGLSQDFGSIWPQFDEIYRFHLQSI